MDIVRKTVLFVVVLVVGIILIAYVIPPFTDVILGRADVGQYTGLEAFTRLLPFLAVLGLVVSGLVVLFKVARRRDDTPGDVGLPPGYTRSSRWTWRR